MTDENIKLRLEALEEHLRRQDKRLAEIDPTWLPFVDGKRPTLPERVRDFAADLWAFKMFATLSEIAEADVVDECLQAKARIAVRESAKLYREKAKELDRLRQLGGDSPPPSEPKNAEER